MDDAWKRQAGISDSEVLTINPERDAESYGFHPAVWQEAQLRWVQKPDEEKTTERSAVEAEIRDTYGIGEALELDELKGKIHILAAVVAGLFSLFVPIWGFFFCTCSGVIGAFKLGAGLVTD